MSFPDVLFPFHDSLNDHKLFISRSYSQDNMTNTQDHAYDWTPERGYLPGSYHPNSNPRPSVGTTLIGCATFRSFHLYANSLNALYFI